MQQSLLFEEVLSNKIKQTVLQRKNKRESTRRIVAGIILRKYKAVHFAVSETSNNGRKLSTTSSKVIKLKKSKHGFEPKLDENVVDFYGRNSNSTALPGKWDAKSIKLNMAKLGKRTLNYYLSNLCPKYVEENSYHNLLFSTFVRMRPPYCILANFVNRCSCLCTQYQNMELKLKMFKNCNKYISVHPDIFVKNQSEGDSNALLQLIVVDNCEYETHSSRYM